MKGLIILCALMAFGHAKPGWSYSSIDVASPVFYSAHGIIGAHTPALAVPAAYATRTFPTVPAAIATRTFPTVPAAIATRTFATVPAVATAPILASAPAIATAPVISAAPAVAAAPIVEARTVDVAPVVAAAPVVATKTIATAPLVAAAAPVVAAAPAVLAAPTVVKSQWHAQDEIGQASYGHAEPGQTHTAVQDALGNKAGSYSYLNPTDGLIHRTDYVADSLGYRVTANDLPVAPSAPVIDTPEVAIAKAAHLAAVRRVKRGVVLAAHTPASTVPLSTPIIAAAPAITTYAAAPVLAHRPISYAAHAIAPAAISYAAPLAAAPILAPALRDATLTTVVNTPGHAVSYRVD